MTYKNKHIKCLDCQEEIERLTPNHKRCIECADKKKKERAIIASSKLSPEINRQRFKDWYYQNLDRERKLRLERYHKSK